MNTANLSVNERMRAGEFSLPAAPRKGQRMVQYYSMSPRIIVCVNVPKKDTHGNIIDGAFHTIAAEFSHVNDQCGIYNATDQRVIDEFEARRQRALDAGTEPDIMTREEWMEKNTPDSVKIANLRNELAHLRQMRERNPLVERAVGEGDEEAAKQGAAEEANAYLAKAQAAETEAERMIREMQDDHPHGAQHVGMATTASHGKAPKVPRVPAARR